MSIARSRVFKQRFLKELEGLSEEKINEVYDFIAFLREREKLSTPMITKLSEPSFNRIWDNEEDSAYDDL